MRHVFRILVCEVLEIPRDGWEDNIKMVLKDMGNEGMDWVICFKMESNGRFL
jgi:hypothetical protein